MRSAAHCPHEAHGTRGGAHLDPATHGSTPNEATPGLPSRLRIAQMRLTMAAARLDDAEAYREAITEQLRSFLGLTGYEVEKGLSAKALAETVSQNGAAPEAKALAQQLELHMEIERIATLELRHAMRVHPLHEWVLSVRGIGEKAVGRLLGAVGDPTKRVDPETEEVYPRTLSQFRSYCGYGDAQAQRRRCGFKLNYNQRAKVAVWNIAEAAYRQGDYREVYVAAREKYADAVHTDHCPQCGKKGQPAEPGSDLRDGHKHARAHRAVAKAFLKDLWLQAREVSNA